MFAVAGVDVFVRMIVRWQGGERLYAEVSQENSLSPVGRLALLGSN
jgi:hypothetical protein